MTCIFYKTKVRLLQKTGIFIPFILSIGIIFFALKANHPDTAITSFVFTSDKGPTHFHPNHEKYKVIILFSTRCPFCMSYLSRMNREIDFLPDCQYGLFTTDKDLYRSLFYDNWDEIKSDSRFSIGILDISTAYKHFGDHSLPFTLIYNRNNYLEYSLRGEADIRDIANRIPDVNQ